ncbi:MAG: alpha/beta fold hydrolase, partial [Pseudomonadota bacterium]
MRGLLAGLLLALPGAAAAQDVCGGEVTCEIEGGTYMIERPADDGPVPAVVFLHGFGGSGEGSMRQSGMVDAFVARGYAVIAPDGQARQGGGGLRWDFRPAEGRGSRDDDAFLTDVVADAAMRHGIDGDEVILSGFSNGAFLVTYLAGRDPGAFAAYAPVSGGFWRPHPPGCAGPVRLFQTHGWADSTVPIEG